MLYIYIMQATKNIETMTNEVTENRNLISVGDDLIECLTSL